MGFVVKWFIIYPGVAIFGVGLAIMLATFYGLFWGGFVVRCGIVGGVGRSLGVSLFSILSHDRMVLFRFGGRFGLSPMVSFQPGGSARL